MKNYVFYELNKNEPFDPLTLFPDTPFTQAPFYGEWQENLKREVKRFIVSKQGKVVAYFQLIKYPLFRDKNYFSIPYGPIVGEFSEPLLRLLQTKLRAIAKINKAIFTRLDFTPPVKDDETKKLLAKLFTKAFRATYHSAHFQPRAEWLLDLNKSEKDLLGDMREKTRYSVRLAEKKGITIEVVTSGFEKYFEIFYELMAGTAKRNRFNLHQRNYYENIFQNLQSNNSYLVIARHEKEILVVKLIIRYGSTAYSVFSGSSNDHRNLRPTYLVQWTAISQAKKLGHNFYNFGGITSGKIYGGWAGLTVFKKGFGGKEIVHSDFFDIVNQPFWYWLYNLRKRLKIIYFKYSGAFSANQSIS